MLAMLSTSEHPSVPVSVYPHTALDVPEAPERLGDIECEHSPASQGVQLRVPAWMSSMYFVANGHVMHSPPLAEIDPV